MTEDGAVGSQRLAGNRLTSTTVLGRLDIERRGQYEQYALSHGQPV